LEQVAIALTGVVAVWLTQQNNHTLRKYACIFGLTGQPFWFYAAYTSEQWGILILTVFYTYSWYLGFKNYWLHV